MTLDEWKDRLRLMSRSTLADMTPQECGDLLRALESADAGGIVEAVVASVEVRPPTHLPSSEYRVSGEGRQWVAVYSPPPRPGASSWLSVGHESFDAARDAVWKHFKARLRAGNGEGW